MQPREKANQSLSFLTMLAESKNSESNKHYLKLRFMEQVIFEGSKHCRLKVSLQQSEILTELPVNIKSNEKLHRTKFIYDTVANDYKHYEVRKREEYEDPQSIFALEDKKRSMIESYDCYYDCSTVDINQIECALDLLKYRYEKNKDMNGEIAFFAEQSYLRNPIQNNFILVDFKKCIKEAHYYDVAALSVSQEQLAQVSTYPAATVPLDDNAPKAPSLFAPQNRKECLEKEPCEKDGAFNRFLNKLSQY